MLNLQVSKLCNSTLRSCRVLCSFPVAVLLLVFVAGCGSPPQVPLDEPVVKLTIQSDRPAYRKTRDGGTEQVRAPKNATVDLSQKAVVVMRGQLRAPSHFVYKAIGINYTTQEVDFLRWDGPSSTNLIQYRSERNSFHAFVVEPGTYRYAWNVLGNPERLGSRYSPTKLIEFTVNAGEAVYVGDLKVILTDDYFSLSKDGTFFKLRRYGFVDYQFSVEKDESAAQAFYASLALENAPSLQSRIMTIKPMPQIRRYTDADCDSLVVLGLYGRRPCVIAHDQEDWGIPLPH